MHKITVISYNIRHGEADDGTVSLERISHVLERFDCDMIGLQEVDRYLPRSYFEDQAAYLAKRLNMQHVFAPQKKLWGKLASGNALLSRYPVIHQVMHQLGGDQDEGVLLRAGINLDGTRITCLNTRLSANSMSRPKQIRDIIRVIRGIRSPAVLLGDFGVEPGDEAMAELLAFWQDSGRGRELGTYPSRRPEKRADYILFSEHWQVISCQMYRTVWSDHLPVVAEAALI